MTSAMSLAAGGYVRMPRAWITLPVSPGAKALLIHFCSAADANGESWYSYGQMTEIVRRSRAAIAGYVAELRDAKIIDTLSQKTANGFNYRLKVRILGWADLVAGWASLAAKPRPCAPAARARSATRRPVGNATPAVAESLAAATEPDATSTEDDERSDHPGDLPSTSAERRVHPAERMDPSGPESTIQTNNTGPAAAGWSKQDEIDWRAAKARDKDGYLGFDRAPDDALLHRAIATHASLRAGSDHFPDRPAAAAAATRALVAFVAAKRLVRDQPAIEAAAEALAPLATTPLALAAIIDRLDGTWSSHWRRLSSPRQLQETAAAARAESPASFAPDPLLATFDWRAFLARREIARRNASRHMARTDARTDASTDASAGPRGRPVAMACDRTDVADPPARASRRRLPDDLAIIVAGLTDTLPTPKPCGF